MKIFNVCKSSGCKTTDAFYPTIMLGGNWIAEMGFKIGSFATREYANGEITIRLINDVTFEQSEIIRKAIKSGKSNFLEIKNKLAFDIYRPLIQIQSKSLTAYGFEIGTSVLVEYEYGIIKIHHFDIDKFIQSLPLAEVPESPQNKDFQVTSVYARTQKSGCVSPVVRVSGSWLPNIGFNIYKFVKVEHSNGNVKIRLFEGLSPIQKEILQEIIQTKKRNFLTVKGHANMPEITLCQKYWAETEFKIGNPVVIKYAYGFIELSPLNVDNLIQSLSYVQGSDNQLSVCIKMYTKFVLKVICHFKTISYFPKLCFKGDWLQEIGFKVGTFAHIEYSEDAILIKALDNVTPEQAKLLKKLIKTKRGKLLCVWLAYAKKKFVPIVYISGKHLKKHGFKIGSRVMVECRYGVIKVTLRKKKKIRLLKISGLPTKIFTIKSWKSMARVPIRSTFKVLTKIITVNSNIKNTVKIPSIGLSGKLLLEWGFQIDDFASVQYSDRNIIITAHDDAIETYKILSKEMIKNKSGNFFNISTKHAEHGCFPYIKIRGKQLNKYGFEIGTQVLAKFSYKSIELKVL
ncbi:MAG: hypothetical protein C0412_13525 [Flavobacterium sp.]|nr:hypothetical protein [Flavobacterium sp.]